MAVPNAVSRETLRAARAHPAIGLIMSNSGVAPGKAAAARVFALVWKGRVKGWRAPLGAPASFSGRYYAIVARTHLSCHSTIFLDSVHRNMFLVYKAHGYRTVHSQLSYYSRL